MIKRNLILEIDFINNVIAWGNSPADPNLGAIADKKYGFSDELKGKFLTQVDSFWHNENDQLQFFQLFNTGEYFCQRKKKKINFSNDSFYWIQYEFKAASTSQAEDLNQQLTTFYNVVREVKQLNAEKIIAKVDHEAAFFEQRWYKVRREKRVMLSQSDWRVLPDINDSYDGEKAEWIAWRSYLRDMVILSPNDESFNNSGLAWFKHVMNTRYPIDPVNYRKKYPNGLDEDGNAAPAFMDADDSNQWTKYDSIASSDFYKSREQNVVAMAGTAFVGKKRIDQSVKDLMQLLRVEDEVPVNWSDYYVEDSELEEDS